MMPTRAARAAIALFFLAVHALHAQVTIVFDYSQDTSTFFSSHPQAKADLQAAGNWIGSHLTDSLSAIAPGGLNTWDADIFNPDDPSTQISLGNISVAANTLRIYVGAANLGGALGLGGPGGYSDASGSTNWLNTVAARGQAGALSATPTDFGPWGGAVTFDTSSSWFFDPNPPGINNKSNATSQGSTTFDFYSVALHEIDHVLGIGTAGSWTDQVTNDAFTGFHSEAAHGGTAITLDSLGEHWAQNTQSTIFGTSTAQEVVMDPSITNGQRKIDTSLDMAALQDIGWQVSATAIPEPAEWTFLLLGAALAGRRRRWLTGAASRG